MNRKFFNERYEYILLQIIAEYGYNINVSQSEIAKKLNVNQSLIFRVLNKLQKNNLLKCQYINKQNLIYCITFCQSILLLNMLKTHLHFWH